MSGDRCPHCDSDLLVDQRQLVPDDYDEPAGTTIYTCTGCTYRFVVFTNLD